MQASKDMDIQKKDILGNTDSGRKKSGTHKIWLRAAAFAMVVLLLLVAAGKICDPIRLGLQDSVSERERYLLHLLSEPEDMVDVAILGAIRYCPPIIYGRTRGLHHISVDSPDNGSGKVISRLRRF